MHEQWPNNMKAILIRLLSELHNIRSANPTEFKKFVNSFFPNEAKNSRNSRKQVR